MKRFQIIERERKRVERERRQQRDAQLLGSHGAASVVRHVDAASYQPEPVRTSRPPPKPNNTIALLGAADSILIADAQAAPRQALRHAGASEDSCGSVLRGAAAGSRSRVGTVILLKRESANYRRL
jgi:hypothetical protein